MTQYMKDDRAILAVLVLALLAQMPHAQYVFYNHGHGSGFMAHVIAWFYAIALETAVLVFVMRGVANASWGFAGYSVLINIAYYFDLQLGQWPVILLSVGLPTAIALYSHEIADQVNAEKEESAVASVSSEVVYTSEDATAGEIYTPVAEDTEMLGTLQALANEQLAANNKLNKSALARELQVSRPTIDKMLKQLQI